MQPTKGMPNAPVGGVALDLERRIEAMNLLHADRIADFERCKNELVLVTQSRDRLQRSFDAERAACNGHILTIGNVWQSADAERKARAEAEALAAGRLAEMARLADKNEALRRHVLIAGCIEVCGVCGKPAPCENYPNHYEAGMRVVNRRAEDAIRERGKAETDCAFWKIRSELMQRQRDMRLEELGERDAWKEAAEWESRDWEYYRNVVVRIGNLFGRAACAADDGSVWDATLCERVPELVKSLKIERDSLLRTLSRSGHDMDTNGQCDSDCPACGEIRELARGGTVDAPDRLRACPPNSMAFCRIGHAAIHYQPANESHGCPLCRALSKLASWEKRLTCGHTEAALMADDPPHCAVCDQAARIDNLEKALGTARDTIQELYTTLKDRADGVSEPGPRPTMTWEEYETVGPGILEIDAALAPHTDPLVPRYEGGTHAHH